MNYTEALNYIHGAKKFPKTGLERFKSFLNLIGNPHKKLKFIHVAGTNGKGSTCAMLSSVLSCAGYKTGLFISPFIVRFNERISINQINIPDDTLARLCEYIVPFNKQNAALGYEELAEFEINTAIAFLYFLEEKCDVVVLETGMGGRLDATNVQDPLLSVITLIDYDHMAILGDTIEKIAYEKSGIVKPHVPVVMYPVQSEGAYNTVKTAAHTNQTQIFMPDTTSLSDISSDGLGSDFIYFGKSYRVSLPGKHQVYNALTVLEALKHLEGFDISEDDIKNGLSDVRFPARMEKLCDTPLVYFDGAHNISGAKMLYDNIKAIFPDSELILVLGVLKEKGVSMFEPLIRHANQVINVTPDSYRSMDSVEALQETLQYTSSAVSYDSIPQALRYAHDRAKLLSKPLIVCTGSLYLASDIKNYYSRII
ncbi:MAG: bifunctional folylpolyglutamate synthase/dihydrofolate synthase [Ruminococcaceae bacterium]|nr:bifunctional folylpolyglutamate synthase/dihydrofolate synthase [Oscillospiraceae bacterium]